MAKQLRTTYKGYSKGVCPGTLGPKEGLAGSADRSGARVGRLRKGSFIVITILPSHMIRKDEVI